MCQEANKQDHEHRGPDAGTTQATIHLQQYAPHLVGVPVQQSTAHQQEIGTAQGQGHGQQERHPIVQASQDGHGHQESTGQEQVFAPGVAEATTIRTHRMPLAEQRWLAETVLHGVLRADRHAVQVLQAAGVGDHAVQGELPMYKDVRRTDLCTQAALAAILRQHDATWSELIGEPEQGAIGAGLEAETTTAQEVHDDEAAHEEGEHGHAGWRQVAPHIVGSERGPARAARLHHVHGLRSHAMP